MTVTPETQVGGLSIEFKNGTAESEVKSILKNCNMIVNYTTDYNVDYLESKNYIMVEKDRIMDVRGELGKLENWSESEFETKKGNYYIITVPEEFIQDENFLKIVEKNNLQVKNVVWCYIRFEKRT